MYVCMYMCVSVSVCMYVVNSGISTVHSLKYIDSDYDIYAGFYFKRSLKLLRSMLKEIGSHE